MTQIRVAGIVGITNVQLSRYESDTHKPDPELLVKFARLYDVSVDYLVGNASHQRKTKEADEPRVELEPHEKLLRDIQSGIPLEELKKNYDLTLDGQYINDEVWEWIFTLVRVHRESKS